METRESSLLVIVLDCHPIFWGRRAGDEKGIHFDKFLESVLVLTNSHLLLDARNTVALIACHTKKSEFLYPTAAQSSEGTQSSPVNGTPSASSGNNTTTIVSAATMVNDGRYEQFQVMNETVKAQLRELVLGIPADSADGSVDSKIEGIQLTGGLSQALCYIQRSIRQAPAGTVVKPRILVMQASPDAPHSYSDMMNCIFAAQKASIPIDACIIEYSSGFLQQASDITGGIYLRIDDTSALLQYLLFVFLTDQAARSMLDMPAPKQVDYRAACFCHRQLVDVGFVCSVCLSIFCQFTPICQTCNTHFKLPALKRKKA
eukprot:scpid8548/ scgid29234/ General transcription factor IIH subunit 3; General transcription factor IIH polypeptide 3